MSQVLDFRNESGSLFDTGWHDHDGTAPAPQIEQTFIPQRLIHLEHRVAVHTQRVRKVVSCG